MSETANLLILTASIVELEAMRYTPAGLPALNLKLEHAFKFNDAVLRHLTVLKKKADTGPSSMMKTVEREETRKTQQAEYNA